VSARVLHFEDNADDAHLIARTLGKLSPAPIITLVMRSESYLAALEQGGFDIILCDVSLPAYSATEAMTAARATHPRIPFIVLSGGENAVLAEQAYKNAGAFDYISKQDLGKLGPAIERALSRPATSQTLSYERALEYLIAVTQKLSLARSLEDVMSVVRHAARELVGADGATFILRENDLCYYADEEAIGPLWRGQKFPMDACVSGWVMQNQQSVAIEDIYADERVPLDAYRPTFVKSLAIVPIRKDAPIGAIGAYWANTHRASEREIALLQALADSASVTLENVDLYNALQQRVNARAAELESVSKELESFSYSVSHDLRAPLRSIDGFSRLLLDSAPNLEGTAKESLDRIRNATQRMGLLIDELLSLSRVNRAPLELQAIDLAALANEVMNTFRATAPERQVDWKIDKHITLHGDLNLMRIALNRLLSNAWKFTSKLERAKIEIGVSTAAEPVYFVRDNGAGFDMAYVDKLFGAFQRLHGHNEFPGVGIGLAVAARAIHRQGGKIWAEAAVDRGATFYFSLPAIHQGEQT
jgi:signal transduction histidine kinase/DNA-binding NarL/FixJ family response regulator